MFIHHSSSYMEIMLFHCIFICIQSYKQYSDSYFDKIIKKSIKTLTA